MSSPAHQSNLAKDMRRRGRQERKKAVKERLRPFFRGEEEATLDRRSLQLLKRFIAFKEHQALKRNPFIYDFTPTERTSIKNGFSWLLQRMEPKAAPGKRFLAVLDEEKKCFKMSRTELEKWLSANDITSPQQHKALFGLTGLLFKTIDGVKRPISEKKPAAENGILMYNAVRFPGKMLFGNNSPPAILSSYAVHELAHERYGLGEPLCYAIHNYYLWENRLLAEKEIDAELMERRRYPEGRAEGLGILKSAIIQSNPQQAFWVKIHLLSRRPKYRL